MRRACANARVSPILYSSDKKSLGPTHKYPLNEYGFTLLCTSATYLKQKLLNISSLKCYRVLSDIFVKIELCIPLERGSNVLSTGKDFICLSPPSKLKFAVLFCSIYTKPISFSAIVF